MAELILPPGSSPSASLVLPPGLSIGETTPAIGLKKEKPSFVGYLAGENELFPRTGKEGFFGKVGKGVGNFLGRLFRGPLSLAGTTTQVPQVPAQLEQEANYQMIQEQLGKAADDITKKIQSIKDPEQKKSLAAKILPIWQARLKGELPETLTPKLLDKSVSQILGETAEAELLALIFAPGISFIPGVNKVFDSLLKTPLQQYGLKEAGKLGVMSLGMGTEGALYSTASRFAEPGQKPTREDIAKDAARGFGISAALGPLVGLGLGKLFKGKAINIVKEAAEDSALSNKIKPKIATVETVTETIRPGATRLIRALPESAEQAVELRRDTTILRAGDIIETETGFRGVVRAIEEVSIPLDEKIAQGTVITSAREQFSIQSRSIARITEALKEARGVTAKRLSASLRAVSESRDQVERILSKDKTLEESVDILSRERTIRVETEDGNIIEFPFKEVQGGRVRARILVTPTNLEELSKRSQISAIKSVDEVVNAQIESGRNFIPIRDKDGNLISRIDLPEGTDLGSNSEIINRNIINQMRERGHLVFDPRFGTEFLPGRAVLPAVFTPGRTFRQSGAQFRHVAEVVERFQNESSAFQEELSQLLKEVQDEAGISRSLFSSLRRGQASKASELEKRLFKAANEPNFGNLQLTEKERRLITRSQEINANLIGRVQEVEEALGLPVTKERSIYITNVLTRAARAFREFGPLSGGSGEVPRELIKLLAGKPGTEIIRRFPKEVLDPLLERRVGGLPIEESFSQAMSTGIQAHLRFIHLTPAIRELELAVKQFSALYGQSFETNVKFMEDIINRLAGRKRSSAEYLRAFDKQIQSFLIAKKWAGFNNPLSKTLSQEFKLDIGGRIEKFLIPKDWVINLSDQVGFAQWPRLLRATKYAAELSFSLPYATVNLTQFWSLVPPKLRGSAKEIYSDAIRGWLDAWSELVFNRATAWPKYRAMGLFNEVDNMMEIEMGLKKGLGEKITGRKGIIQTILGLNSEHSEFINRVATIKAVERNIQRDIKKGGQWYKNLSKASQKEIEDYVLSMQMKINSVTQFKHNIATRAQISDDPIGSLYDQFNSFFRNYYEAVAEMWRNSISGNKAFKDIWLKFAETKDFKPVMEYIFNKNVLQGKRGEMMRFVLNNLAFGMVVSSIGASMWSELYGGGLPKGLDALTKVTEGIFEMNDKKVEGGLKDLLIPPSIPPVLNAATQTWSIVSGTEKLDLKNLAIQSYSPFRKPIVSIEAFKALATGEPQYVFDKRTGKPIYMIDPDEAFSKLLFGARSKSEKERLADLDEIQRLKAKQDRQDKQKSRRANQILDELESRDMQGRKKLMHDLSLNEELDEKMVNLLLQDWYEREIYRSGALERALQGLKPEFRAEFIEEKFEKIKKNSPEDYQTLLKKWVVMGIISDEVAARMIE